MGAAASRGSSPSPPAKCSLVETRSTTRLFTVPDYSKWVLMPAGSALLFDTIYLLDIGYNVTVYPAGSDKEAADFVAVVAEPTSHSKCYYHQLDDARILIEILDGSGQERTVFDNHTARPGRNTLAGLKADRVKAYVRFVKRKELEASGCVRKDSFTIRCTLSVDVRVTRSPAQVMEALSANASFSKPAVVGGSHSLTISRFSKLKALLRAGECVHSTQFSLGGSSWYFKVYPNGHCDRTCDMSIFLGRGRSLELATMAEFCFEIVDVSEGPGLVHECTFIKHTFDHKNPHHEFPYEYDMVIDDLDSLVVRCHLRVIKVATPSLLPTEVDEQPA